MDEGRAPERAAGLSDPAVEARLARLDDVLGHLEQIPGRTAELALEAVETLTEVYGEALRRVMAQAAAQPDVVDRLAGDELVRHLLLLHGLHPDPVERRVARVVDDLGGRLRSAGAEIELIDVTDGIAHLTLSSGSGCGTCGSATELADLVRTEVLTAAPELIDVQASAPAPTPALIPVSSLLRRPSTVQVGSA
jgi:Fe-S cluster biogenesis protein NfuA